MSISPRILFRTFAIAEFITWGLLIGALILRSLGVDPVVSLVAGGLHGFVFLCYGAVTIFVWINERWRPWVGFTGLITTLVPFATLPFEIVIDKRGLLSRTWRLGAGQEEPRNFFEHVQAWVLRNTAWAIVLGVVAVVTIFVILLILGPPVPR